MVFPFASALRMLDNDDDDWNDLYDDDDDETILARFWWLWFLVVPSILLASIGILICCCLKCKKNSQKPSTEVQQVEPQIVHVEKPEQVPPQQQPIYVGQLMPIPPPTYDPMLQPAPFYNPAQPFPPVPAA